MVGGGVGAGVDAAEMEGDGEGLAEVGDEGLIGFGLVGAEGVVDVDGGEADAESGFGEGVGGVKEAEEGGGVGAAGDGDAGAVAGAEGRGGEGEHGDQDEWKSLRCNRLRVQSGWRKAKKGAD